MTCVTAGANLDLVFAPESANMLGGTAINITGPCFTPGMKIKCRSVSFSAEKKNVLYLLVKHLLLCSLLRV